jgi:hypothetical protein
VAILKDTTSTIEENLGYGNGLRCDAGEAQVGIVSVFVYAWLSQHVDADHRNQQSFKHRLNEPFE